MGAMTRLMPQERHGRVRANGSICFVNISSQCIGDLFYERRTQQTATFP